ncbi:Extracellular_nuclease [Hexamita inflata]|uniref:Extracellular nuclease n=1 Tax=Hexamita inflata TaxID=28002 RepID=A0AA86RK21_9EUKA|nr:Extracellular nuclease [Hexamita inflata]CAI9922208.1 Extracellular nuclease [Hexamita inflata]CAI9978112.1 Extracellular nuclease [Hexamita inflata]
MLFSLVVSELFPGKYGKELRGLLQKYSQEGHKTLGYSRARQEMYGYVYNDAKDQAVYCVYTGLRMPCKYDSMNSSCNADLNCEHTVPQSFFGKSDPMVSDLHHLRSTWSTANGARSNYPFKELKDSEIDTYYGDKKQTSSSKPKDAENWSGLDSGKSFMPREEQRGDTARAVAYFYTMYPTQAGAITKTFASVDTMIAWDLAHAPTDVQHAQYLRAVEVQGNKNPFQEEIGLSARAYCDMSKNYPCSKYQ